MSSPPKVSVIIPTCNRADMLSEAVASVLSQTDSRFELIVVDDGSTDHTDAVLAGFEGIRVIRQENRGVSAARNTGIRASSGELIALLDSDDLWLPEKLAVQIAFFDAHPEALICQTEEIWIRGGKRVNPKRKHQKRGGDIFEASLHLCLISPSAVMMRKALFDRFGLFDESLPACEDYDLWLRVTCEEPAYLIPEPCIVKRGGHSDQLSASPGLDLFRIRSLSRLIGSGRLSESQKAAAVKVLLEKSTIYINGCRKRGRMEEAGAVELLTAPFSES